MEGDGLGLYRGRDKATWESVRIELRQESFTLSTDDTVFFLAGLV